MFQGITRIAFTLTVLLCLIIESQAAEDCVPNWGPEDAVLVDHLVTQAWWQKGEDVERALSTITSAGEIAEAIDYQRGIANSIHVEGVIRWYQGDVLIAYDHLLRAMSMRREIGDSLGLGRSYNNLGNVLFNQEDFSEALQYYQQGLSIRRALRDSAGLVFSYSNLGDVFLKQSKVEEGLQAYGTAREIAEQIQSSSGLAHIGGRMGHFYLEKGDYDLAAIHWEDALLFARQGNNNALIATLLLDLVEISMMSPGFDIRTQQDNAVEALDLAKKLKTPELEATATRLLAQLSVALGEHSQAFSYNRAYQQLEEEILRIHTDKAITDLRVQFDAERLARETLAEEKAQQFRLLIAIILLVFLLLGIVYYTHHIQQRELRNESEYRTTLEKRNAAFVQQNAELVRANQALDQFARVASHDLKEPLRNIGSFVSLLKRRYAHTWGEEGADYADFVMRGVRQMYAVLDDLMEYSSLSLSSSIRLQEVDMQELVQHSIQSVLSQGNADAQLLIDPLPTIQGQNELLAKLLDNLLANALTFTNKSCPALHVGYQELDKKHLFFLEDDGLGVPADFREKIFHPFQRLDRQAYSGTGIGLALCRRVMQIHGGDIWVEAAEGATGSRFIFTFPKHTNDQAPKWVQQESLGCLAENV